MGAKGFTVTKAGDLARGLSRVFVTYHACINRI
jgi:hypothetical protein